MKKAQMIAGTRRLDERMPLKVDAGGGPMGYKPSKINIPPDLQATPLQDMYGPLAIHSQNQGSHVKPQGVNEPMLNTLIRHNVLRNKVEEIQSRKASTIPPSFSDLKPDPVEADWVQQFQEQTMSPERNSMPIEVNRKSLQVQKAQAPKMSPLQIFSDMKSAKEEPPIPPEMMNPQGDEGVGPDIPEDGADPMMMEGMGTQPPMGVPPEQWALLSPEEQQEYQILARVMHDAIEKHDHDGLKQTINRLYTMIQKMQQPPPMPPGMDPAMGGGPSPEGGPMPGGMPPGPPQGGPGPQPPMPPSGGQPTAKSLGRGISIDLKKARHKHWDESNDASTEALRALIAEGWTPDPGKKQLVLRKQDEQGNWQYKRPVVSRSYHEAPASIAYRGEGKNLEADKGHKFGNHDQWHSYAFEFEDHPEHASMDATTGDDFSRKGFSSLLKVIRQRPKERTKAYTSDLHPSIMNQIHDHDFSPFKAYRHTIETMRKDPNLKHLLSWEERDALGHKHEYHHDWRQKDKELKFVDQSMIDPVTQKPMEGVLNTGGWPERVKKLQGTHGQSFSGAEWQRQADAKAKEMAVRQEDWGEGLGQADMARAKTAHSKIALGGWDDDEGESVTPPVQAVSEKQISDVLPGQDDIKHIFHDERGLPWAKVLYRGDKINPKTGKLYSDPYHIEEHPHSDREMTKKRGREHMSFESLDGAKYAAWHHDAVHLIKREQEQAKAEGRKYEGRVLFPGQEFPTKADPVTQPFLHAIESGKMRYRHEEWYDPILGRVEQHLVPMVSDKAWDHIVTDGELGKIIRNAVHRHVNSLPTPQTVEEGDNREREKQDGVAEGVLLASQIARLKPLGGFVPGSSHGLRDDDESMFEKLLRKSISERLFRNYNVLAHGPASYETGDISHSPNKRQYAQDAHGEGDEFISPGMRTYVPAQEFKDRRLDPWKLGKEELWMSTVGKHIEDPQERDIAYGNLKQELAGIQNFNQAKVWSRDKEWAGRVNPYEKSHETVHVDEVRTPTVSAQDELERQQALEDHYKYLQGHAWDVASEHENINSTHRDIAHKTLQHYGHLLHEGMVQGHTMQDPARQKEVGDAIYDTAERLFALRALNVNKQTIPSKLRQHVRNWVGRFHETMDPPEAAPEHLLPEPQANVQSSAGQPRNQSQSAGASQKQLDTLHSLAEAQSRTSPMGWRDIHHGVLKHVIHLGQQGFPSEAGETHSEKAQWLTGQLTNHAKQLYTDKVQAGHLSSVPTDQKIQSNVHGWVKDFHEHPAVQEITNPIKKAIWSKIEKNDIPAPIRADAGFQKTRKGLLQDKMEQLLLKALSEVAGSEDTVKFKILHDLVKSAPLFNQQRLEQFYQVTRESVALSKGMSPQSFTVHHCAQALGQWYQELSQHPYFREFQNVAKQLAQE